jgi:hypothetical protein
VNRPLAATRRAHSMVLHYPPRRSGMGPVAQLVFKTGEVT